MIFLICILCETVLFHKMTNEKKIRILISLLNKSFLKNTSSTNVFSIDETILFYILGARDANNSFVRFGFKVWMAATINGYCVQLQPYLGVAEKQGEESNDLSSSGNVVFFFSLRFCTPTFPIFIHFL